MYNLLETLKFRDSSGFRFIVDQIADRIAQLPWEVTPKDVGVEQAIAYPSVHLNFAGLVRRSILDMLPLNLAMYEVAVTDEDKFLLDQCNPAQLFLLKDWTPAAPPEVFRWVCHVSESKGDLYLSDQKIAIFPAYGNFEITHEELWGLPSPVHLIRKAIEMKLSLKDEAFPEMGSSKVFDASMSLQNALKEIPEPEPGYASLWNSVFGSTPIQKLKSGIIVPAEPTLILNGNSAGAREYSKWLTNAILSVLLHTYRPLLKESEEEAKIRQALGSCRGYEDIMVAISVIISQGINRLMKNLDIDCKFSFQEKSQKDPNLLLKEEVEKRQTLGQLGYLDEHLADPNRIES
jgi:hypothetical protein